MNIIRRAAIPALITGLIFACAPDPGPFFDGPEFPENQEAFNTGQLGLITPALNDQDELRAFRLLSGLPLPSTVEGTRKPAVLDQNDVMDGWQAWDTVHKAALGPTPRVIADRNSKRGDTHVWYHNCYDNAFATAAATLADRQKTYGSQADLSNWIKAQDQVFSNCDGEKISIPGPPDPASSPLVRADRAYQIAAAHFYAEDLDEAEQSFGNIANDKQSPWQHTAAYMVCRVQMRRASLYGGPDQLTAVHDHLTKIASDPSFGSLAASAQGLSQRVAALQNPEAEMARVSAVLLSPSSSTDAFEKALQDAQYILNSDTFRAAVKQSDIADPLRWVYVLGRDDKTSSLTAWTAWQSKHTLPWLTLALVEASAKDPFADELIKEADTIDPKSPAYGTASYNTIRLFIEKGNDAEARRRLREILSNADRLPPSLVIAYRAERMRVATNFEDMVHWAPRVPTDHSFGPHAPDAPVLAYDAAYILNYKTPLTKIAAAAKSADLPHGSASDVAVAAWTRAFILGKDDIARRMAASISRNHPAWTDSLTPSTDREKWRFRAALLTSLRSSFEPILGVNYRPFLQTEGDWWCTVNLESTRSLTDPQYPRYSQIAWKLPTVFNVPDRVLSASEQAQAQRELEKLSATGSAQEFLASIILPYAERHPSDPDVPLALHRLVMVVRYGCDRANSANGKISKTAFELLHTRYPNSEWTKKTPYWFQ